MHTTAAAATTSTTAATPPPRLRRTPCRLDAPDNCRVGNAGLDGLAECIDLEEDGSFTVTSFTRYDVQSGPGANITGEKAAWRWVGPTLDEAEAEASAAVLGGSLGGNLAAGRQKL